MKVPYWIVEPRKVETRRVMCKNSAATERKFNELNKLIADTERFLGVKFPKGTLFCLSTRGTLLTDTGKCKDKHELDEFHRVTIGDSLWLY